MSLTFEECRGALREWLIANGEPEKTQGAFPLPLCFVIPGEGGKGPAGGWVFSAYDDFYYNVRTDGSITKEPQSNYVAITI